MARDSHHVFGALHFPHSRSPIVVACAKINSGIIDPLVPKDMFRLVCLVKLVFFAREGVAF